MLPCSELNFPAAKAVDTKSKGNRIENQKLLSRGIILITRTFSSCKLEHVVFLCHQRRNSERAMLSLFVPEDPRIPILPKRIGDGADESVEVSLGSTSLFVAFRGPPILQDTPIVWFFDVQLKVLSADVPHLPGCHALEQDMDSIILLLKADKAGRGVIL
jgi:hypothetical protein